MDMSPQSTQDSPQHVTDTSLSKDEQFFSASSDSGSDVGDDDLFFEAATDPVAPVVLENEAALNLVPIRQFLEEGSVILAESGTAAVASSNNPEECVSSSGGSSEGRDPESPSSSSVDTRSGSDSGYLADSDSSNVTSAAGLSTALPDAGGDALLLGGVPRLETISEEARFDDWTSSPVHACEGGSNQDSSEGSLSSAGRQNNKQSIVGPFEKLGPAEASSVSATPEVLSEVEKSSACSSNTAQCERLAFSRAPVQVTSESNACLVATKDRQVTPNDRLMKPFTARTFHDLTPPPPPLLSPQSEAYCDDTQNSQNLVDGQKLIEHLTAIDGDDTESNSFLLWAKLHRTRIGISLVGALAAVAVLMAFIPRGRARM